MKSVNFTCVSVFLISSMSTAQQKFASKADGRTEPKTESRLEYKSKGVAGCQQFPARFVYLNGKNIGTVRNQQLENVKVFVDESGNVNITAAHYDVQQDSSYHPLFASEVPALKGIVDKKTKTIEQGIVKPIDGELSPVESLKPISP